MGSSNSDSIAIAAKYRVRKQRSIIDEGGDKFTPLNDKAMILVVAVTNRFEIDADADANESTMTLFAPQNIKTMILRVAGGLVCCISEVGRVDAVPDRIENIVMPLVLFTPRNTKMMILRAAIESVLDGV